MFQWKVARSHADFFIFETFRRNCPPLVVKSAILKMNKDKKTVTDQIIGLGWVF